RRLLEHHRRISSRLRRDRIRWVRDRESAVVSWQDPVLGGFHRLDSTFHLVCGKRARIPGTGSWLTPGFEANVPGLRRRRNRLDPASVPAQPEPSMPAYRGGGTLPKGL